MQSNVYDDSNKYKQASRTDLFKVMGSPLVELMCFVQCTVQCAMQYTVHYSVQCIL